MEGSNIMKLTAIVVTLLCVIRAVDSCMCLFSHPQAMLCQNQSYAVLAKVRSMEYVYMTETPKYKNPKEKNDDFKDKEFTDLKKDYKHNLKQEMERVEVVVKDLDHLSQKHFTASHIRYRVKVYEAYKGVKPEEARGKKMYIYTAPDDAMCGMKLDSKKTYLLIGYTDGDRLTIGLCDQAIPWSSVDTKQRRVVRRNMRAAKETCSSSCQVETCTWSGCQKPDKDTCVWDAGLDRMNRKLNIDPANYACIREPGVQDAKCKWNNPLTSNKKYRRRRRHQLSSPMSESLTNVQSVVLP